MVYGGKATTVMESLVSLLAQYGLAIVCVAVFVETIGFPVPAAIALLLAGGASANGTLHGPTVVGAALASMLAGDVLMFMMGRYTGWWMLSVLCRLSLNPEACILRSADAFYKRGRALLLFAKFVPGINTMAPPLAGSMNMRFGQFVVRDAVGAALYIGGYWSIGYLFAGTLTAIVGGMQAFGAVLEWLLVGAVAAYLAYLGWTFVKAGSLRSVRRASPSEVLQAVTDHGAAIYDVRSHGYYDPKAVRIRGSVRIEPNALHQQADQREIEAGRPVYLYCTCIREATSARVAKELIDRGVLAAVVEGGLRAWKSAGLPVEPVPADEVTMLPVFETGRSGGHPPR
jgi:membrane protein DedA with SNARE-associated domain/rhodanese-related sulfurtransferase